MTLTFLLKEQPRLGPGSWSGRGVIGCELLLSISCDIRVKI